MSFKSAQFKPGWKGGPGRPAGSRDRLQRQFLYALAEDFDKHGEGAIRICRVEDPVRYVSICASSMPKEFAMTENSLGDLSDDEVRQLLERIRESLLTIELEKAALPAPQEEPVE
jgi:hypothetical protein